MLSEVCLRFNIVLKLTNKGTRRKIRVPGLYNN